MDLRESVAKLFSGSVVLAVIEFAAISGFTQAVGTAAMGSFFVFQAVIGILSIPADLGISKAAEKQLSAKESAGEIISSAIVTKVVLLLPWLFGLVLATPYVEQYIDLPGVVPFVVLGLLAKQGRGLSLRLLAGQMQVDKNAFLKVIGKITWLGAGFGLIELGLDGKAIVISFILGNLVTMVGAGVRMELPLSWPRLSKGRQLVDFGRYVVIGNIGGFIYQWMDVAILRFFVPVSLIGAYEIAWRVASVSMMLTEAIRTSLFPQISQWHAEDRLDAIENAFRKWLQLPLYLTIPAFAGASVLGEDVLRLLFSADAVVAYPVLLIFMLEKILRSVQLVLGPSLFAMDLPHLGYRGSIAAVLVNLILNITLIPRFGLIGAAVATTLSAAVAAVIAINYVNRVIDVQIPRNRVLWSVFSAVVMAALVYLLRETLASGLTRLVLCVGAGVVVYAVLLLTNDGIRLEMQTMVDEFM